MFLWGRKLCWSGIQPCKGAWSEREASHLMRWKSYCLCLRSMCFKFHKVGRQKCMKCHFTSYSMDSWDSEWWHLQEEIQKQNTVTDERILRMGQSPVRQVNQGSNDIQTINDGNYQVERLQLYMLSPWLDFTQLCSYIWRFQLRQDSPSAGFIYSTAWWHLFIVSQPSY